MFPLLKESSKDLFQENTIFEQFIYNHQKVVSTTGRRGNGVICYYTIMLKNESKLADLICGVGFVSLSTSEGYDIVQVIIPNEETCRDNEN